jgi:hypothetical protein
MTPKLLWEPVRITSPRARGPGSRGLRTRGSGQARAPARRATLKVPAGCPVKTLRKTTLETGLPSSG